jgi:hypothetical protein
MRLIHDLSAFEKQIVFHGVSFQDGRTDPDFGSRLVPICFGFLRHEVHHSGCLYHMKSFHFNALLEKSLGDLFENA